MRLTNLQALRGVACLLVLVFHASEWELKRCADVAVRVTEPFQHFGYAGVDLFFVLSGFVITWVTFAKLGDRSQFLDFTWRRLWRILPLYWACWVGVILAYTFILRQPFIPTARWFIGNILILPAQPMHLFIPQAWSLAYELLFYGVFALLFLVPRRAALPALAAWFVVIVACALQGIPAPVARGPIGRCAVQLINPLVLEFLIGCAAAALLRSDRGWRWGRWALIAGIAGFAATGAAQFAGWIDTKIDYLVRAATFGLSSGLVVFGATASERAFGLSSPRWLQVVGDASYSIYLVHIGVLEVVQHWWGSLPHALGLHLIYLAALIGGSLAVGFAVYFTVERPILRVLQRRPKPDARSVPPQRRAA